MKVDAIFPVSGRFPILHEYPLFGAISNLIPDFHADKTGKNGVDVAISRINGVKRVGYMESEENSCFTIRADQNLIAVLLKLANKELSLSRLKIRIGNPQIQKLCPSKRLRCSRVIISMDGVDNVVRNNFEQSVRKQVGPDCNIELIRQERVKIKDRVHLGYSVAIHDLSNENSLRILESGVGGKKKYGCGMFFSF